MPVALPFLARRRKRKALVIGINYASHQDPSFRLRCCIEDAYSMANFLCDHLGFERRDVRIMTDTTPGDRPTKANILEAMNALVHDAQPGDSFFFYFSGHGIQIKDTSGDETDGLDECICAIDYRGDEQLPNEHTAGVIVDDRMHELLVQPLPRECRLTAIFDSCHSGTVLDLPYLYSSQGAVKEITHPHRLRVLRQKSSYADVISIGASKDHQIASETNGKGALRSASIIQLACHLHDLNRVINPTGFRRVHV
ncbi:peptidase C14, caspase domain-containing protein [Russula brevipes]|nr:peptidase C14, caspase domain-containing protein [Russula brevipes]